MARMRARRKVQIERFTAENFDPYGEPIPAYAPPVTHRVLGWAPLTIEEMKLAGYDRQVRPLTMYVPDDFPELDRRDRIILPRLGRFEVEGGVQWWSDGPFNYKPGGTVRIIQVDG